MLRDFYILGAILAEYEAEPPLLVDSDAVLAFAISGERLQPVARRYAQILQAQRRIKLLQFRERALSNVRRMERTGSSANAAAVSLSLNDLIATNNNNEVRY